MGRGVLGVRGRETFGFGEEMNLFGGGGVGWVLPDGVGAINCKGHFNNFIITTISESVALGFAQHGCYIFECLFAPKRSRMRASQGTTLTFCSAA